MKHKPLLLAAAGVILFSSALAIILWTHESSLRFGFQHPQREVAIDAGPSLAGWDSLVDASIESTDFEGALRARLRDHPSMAEWSVDQFQFRSWSGTGGAVGMLVSPVLPTRYSVISLGRDPSRREEDLETAAAHDATIDGVIQAVVAEFIPRWEAQIENSHQMRREIMTLRRQIDRASGSALRIPHHLGNVRENWPRQIEKLTVALEILRPLAEHAHLARGKKRVRVEYFEPFVSPLQRQITDRDVASEEAFSSWLETKSLIELRQDDLDRFADELSRKQSIYIQARTSGAVAKPIGHRRFERFIEAMVVPLTSTTTESITFTESRRGDGTESFNVSLTDGVADLQRSFDIGDGEEEWLDWIDSYMVSGTNTPPAVEKLRRILGAQIAFTDETEIEWAHPRKEQIRWDEIEPILAQLEESASELRAAGVRSIQPRGGQLIFSISHDRRSTIPMQPIATVSQRMLDAARAYGATEERALQLAAVLERRNALELRLFDGGSMIELDTGLAIADLSEALDRLEIAIDRLPAPRWFDEWPFRSIWIGRGNPGWESVPRIGPAGTRFWNAKCTIPFRTDVIRIEKLFAEPPLNQ